MNEIINNTIGELVGYVVRLEICGNDKSVNQELNVHYHHQGGLSLQFKFNPRLNSYYGEFVAEMNS